jgi:hypothetical protein
MQIKKETREVIRDSWDKYVTNIEHNLHDTVLYT